MISYIENTLGDTMLFEYFKEAEQKLTRSGFMAQLGFPKEYGGSTVTNLLRA